MGAAKKFERMPEEVFLETVMKEGRCKIMPVSIAPKALVVDPSRYQMRCEKLDKGHSKRFADMLKQGLEIFPCVVFRSPKRMILADGFHRHDAYKSAGMDYMRAYVVDVSDGEIEREAMLYAAMCNRLAVKTRTGEDIQKACEAMFADPVCWKWTSERIASHCGCSRHTVEKHRNQYAISNGIERPLVLESASGKRIPSTSHLKGERVIHEESVGNYSRFRASYKGRRFAGPTAEIVQAKIDEAKQTIVDRSIMLKTLGHFRTWALKRKVVLEPCSLAVGPLANGCLACVKNSSCLLVTLDKGSTILQFSQAVGTLHLLRRHSGMLDARLVVVCYPEDQSSTLLDLARQDGIEFLSPDELVASLKGEATCPTTPTKS